MLHSKANRAMYLMRYTCTFASSFADTNFGRCNLKENIIIKRTGAL